MGLSCKFSLNPIHWYILLYYWDSHIGIDIINQFNHYTQLFQDIRIPSCSGMINHIPVIPVIFPVYEKIATRCKSWPGHWESIIYTILEILFYFGGVPIHKCCRGCWKNMFLGCSGMNRGQNPTDKYGDLYSSWDSQQLRSMDSGKIRHFFLQFETIVHTLWNHTSWGSGKIRQTLGINMD